jgi:hypothetical protein
MPPTTGNTSEGPSAGTVSTKQLWTVKLGGDTTEIDLCGAVIKSSHPALQCETVYDAGEFAFDLTSLGSAGEEAQTLMIAMHAQFLTEARNLHILNGGLEFGAGSHPLIACQPYTTLRLTSVTLTVNDDVVEDLSKADSVISTVAGTSAPHSSLILEDCVFETACQSPVLSRLSVCMALTGGQVGVQDSGYGGGAAVTCYSCHLLYRPTLNCLACFICSCRSR